MFRWLAKFINTLIHYANCNESLLKLDCWEGVLTQTNISDDYLRN